MNRHMVHNCRTRLFTANTGRVFVGIDGSLVECLRRGIAAAWHVRIMEDQQTPPPSSRSTPGSLGEKNVSESDGIRYFEDRQ